MATAPSSNPSPSDQAAAEPQVVTGVQLMQGIGIRPAVGFWQDAWQSVMKQRTAVAAIIWLSIIAFFAVFAPLIASGHPLWITTSSGRSFSPLWQNLQTLDLVLLATAFVGLPYIFLLPRPATTPGSSSVQSSSKGSRAKVVLASLLLAILIMSIVGIIQARLDAAATEQARSLIGKTISPNTDIAVPLARREGIGYLVAALIAIPLCSLAIYLFTSPGARTRGIIAALLVTIITTFAIGSRWEQPLRRYAYLTDQQAGLITSATYTLVPWSPDQPFSDLSRKEPMTSFGEARRLDPAAPGADFTFVMGTDAIGNDVFSQILHACRLSISIGVVSTGIALMIGVTMGAMMGYFGGWIDLFLSRIVEIFMAIPVLFLLIVSVAVLPDELKTTYVIMAIIGCFSWTGMARFTRAEFLKLRNQEFVQAAQAAGLPLRSILFKHMLPNGVAPVLVDTSFAVAAAISIEATLSYLGLGPVDSPSWGKLLSSAVSQEGEFKWWLAVFPGVAIFLTILSYNFFGEAMRDAIDPKLKKARV